MKAAFYTLGCKVNQYETEYMAELLRNAGFEIVKENDEADYYIVNSCTVTATADQKTRKSIRKFKRNHPNSTVILTGCMPQAFPKEAKELIEADIVFSNKNDGDILSLINEYNLNKNRLIKIEEHKAGDNFWDCSIDRLLKLRTVVTDFVLTVLFQNQEAEFVQNRSICSKTRLKRFQTPALRKLYLSE